MSRCFPFPPPGYEKKIRIGDAGSLIKQEKHKEKKHKKDKKDKEKKEGKEKKDKETSKDKHKERKEKKEKHKDRKDKDRNKEKSRTSEDKKTAGVLPRNGEKEKLVTDTCQNNVDGDTKFILDLARMIRDDEEATESESPQKIAENHVSCPVPHTNHTKVHEKRINTHRNFTLAKGPENTVLRVSSSTDQKGGEVLVKPPEKRDHAKEKELQEKNHRRESVTKSDKLLDKEATKKSEPKTVTDGSSKERREEKTEVINKTGPEKPKFVEGGPRLKEREHNSADARNFRVPEFSKGSVKNLTSEGILGKQKDLETNGFSYADGSRPNKTQRPVSSSLSSVENGRKLGACQNPPKTVSELQGILCKPEVKEHKINGFIDSQEHPKSHPPASSLKVKENGEASAKKRPHSDLKYLDQILNVPKREELQEVDDDELEWLFGQSGMKKQRTDSSTSLEETQVWNKARRIESADIVALPYVVPF